jgi:DNA-directed RNA polymerase subunit RPC12/RpoP
MENFSFDSMELPITCPRCGHQRGVKVGVLRKGPLVQCPKCKVIVTFDYRNLDEGLRGPEQTIAAMLRRAPG